MRILFMGGGEFGCPTLKYLAHSEHDVIEVFTQPARKAGRGRKVTPTAVSALAAELDLPYREVADVNVPEIVERVRQLNPDVILVIAFGQFLGNELLAMDCRVINLHGSILPKYRGAAPINWAIINGEKTAGLTVIELNEIWDAGNMLGVARTEIGPTETAGELHDRMAVELGPSIVAEALGEIVAGIDEPIVQDNAQACKAPKLRKADGRIDWTKSAEELRCFIHGMWPWPGAFCKLKQADSDKEVRVSIARAQVVPEAGGEPGVINDDMTISCGTDSLKLLEIKPDNSKLLKFNDFVNGRRLKPHDRFI